MWKYSGRARESSRNWPGDSNSVNFKLSYWQKQLHYLKAGKNWGKKVISILLNWCGTEKIWLSITIYTKRVLAFQKRPPEWRLEGFRGGCSSASFFLRILAMIGQSWITASYWSIKGLHCRICVLFFPCRLYKEKTKHKFFAWFLPINMKMQLVGIHFKR